MQGFVSNVFAILIASITVTLVLAFAMSGLALTVYLLLPKDHSFRARLSRVAKASPKYALAFVKGAQSFLFYGMVLLLVYLAFNNVGV
jgi:hypothetical protein